MTRIVLSPTVTLFHADSRDVLRSLPDNSVDAVPCDPPYELNFMGKGWDDTGIANDKAFWAEVFRVLKPGGHLAAFSASRTYHRMVCAIEDAGFEIRDSLMWLYGTGFPKSQNVAKFIDKELGVIGTRGAPKLLPNGREHHFNIGFGEGEGYDSAAADRFGYVPASPQAREFESFGTALKPAFEPIVLARKPLSEPTVAANVLRWRTGALNIDGCRVEASATDVAEMAGRSGKSTPNKIYGAGIGGVQEGTWQPRTDGRWPANVVTDGSDEVVGMFPQSNGQIARAKTDGTRKSGRRFLGALKHGTRQPEPRGDSGSAARFFYSAKASKADRNGSKHPTVKPIALMQWLARLITPPGGTVLDPFAGSGTTGAAAAREGFAAILIEREAEYIADIKRRFGGADWAAFRAALARQDQVRAAWGELELALRARIA